MTIVSIIGAGHIGMPVIDAITSGSLPGYRLGKVLVSDRSKRTANDGTYTDDWNDLAQSTPDIILELAGPSAFRAFAERAISVAETWSISSAAMAEVEFDKTITRSLIANRRLRFLSGAIGGLDAIAAAAVDPSSEIIITAALSTTPPDAEPDVIGSARDIVQRFEGVNVVSAIALAGHGLDKTRVRYFHRPGTEQRRFVVDVSSQHGQYRLESRPTPKPGPSAVVASVLSALRARSNRIVIG
ncbi:aspartate dehydrogenase domain-containing protein [Ensifer sp. YR511]|uniref:aspartate dehydrogenase domain-containing protein n=1 Tax=Ensifer sp. YR511 TaxID=1855294 RepID=UPI000890A766|nr:aspartate dehydrogenase domain-containing protein [Ensifer sp. YR511]SDN42314.1 Homoserine dehydrogenase, NAD binding domain [Ensifer sp. YR511]